MDHVKFPYRSSSHLALMHVIDGCGAWKRQDLAVEYNKGIGRDDAHKLVPTADVEFVSGNHVSTYAARARGDKWVYLGQTMSNNHMALVTRQDSGINKLADVRGKKFGSRGRHPGLNTWLYLKQHGLDPDKDAVEIVRHAVPETSNEVDEPAGRKSLGKMVADGDVDACFLTEPQIEFARRAGLKVIDIESQPMIFFMTVSSSKKLVDTRPDIVDRMLKGIIEGIAYFKQNREDTIKILMERYDSSGKLDRDAAEKLYARIAPDLEPRLYPGLDAIYNVYQEALKQDEEHGDAARIHPLALWDFHFVRKIDDSGFIDDLYKKNPKFLEGHGG